MYEQGTGRGTGMHLLSPSRVGAFSMSDHSVNVQPLVACPCGSDGSGQVHSAHVTIALLQHSAVLADIPRNSETLTAMVEAAAAQGAKIIVAPEAALTGYVSQDLTTNWRVPGRPMDDRFSHSLHPAQYALTCGDEAIKHFLDLAGRLEVYLTVPFVEVVRRKAQGVEGETEAEATKQPEENPEDGTHEMASEAERKAEGEMREKFFNTVILAGPDGTELARYRKLTPWPVPEQSWAEPGDLPLPVVSTPYGDIGLAICYDHHHCLRSYSDRLWALLYPIAWADDNYPADWFYHVLPRRVAKRHFWLLGANWSVEKRPVPQWFGYGFSSVISPQGSVVATARALYGDTVVLASIPTADAVAALPGSWAREAVTTGRDYDSDHDEKEYNNQI